MNVDGRGPVTRVRPHADRYRGWRPLRVTVTCRCGWVSERHRSRGEARRAWEGHLYLAGLADGLTEAVGVDAHRRQP